MPQFHSLLYREPRLYELAFPDDGQATAGLVRDAIQKYSGSMPRSVLDVGCGSGRLLQLLADIPERAGIDLLTTNIDYATATRPGITFLVGDMRTLRLNRTFDLVTCLGNVVSYAVSDHELYATFDTLAAHTHPGAMLVADALNARAYLDGDGFRERIESCVDTPEFSATSVSIHSLDRQARVLRRQRTWHRADAPDVVDVAEYRLLLPEEMERLLDSRGFELLGLYDNRSFEATTLRGGGAPDGDVGGMRGRKLYAFARARSRGSDTRPPDRERGRGSTRA
ncbi:MAG TPA: class I SAM-dependent methyltransferase [Methylomirabilota bacterium]|jgi:SAM-dependent methyltransferase|nr:class I SAM-dependent methyltransferase [Methylomirabilota bacterium]